MKWKAGGEAGTISYSSTVIKAWGSLQHWMPMMLKIDGEAGTISYHTVIKACAEARDGEAGTISYHTVMHALKHTMWLEFIVNRMSMMLKAGVFEQC